LRQPYAATAGGELARANYSNIHNILTLGYTSANVQVGRSADGN